MKSFSPIWILEEAQLTDTQVLQLEQHLGRKYKIYWKFFPFENEIQSQIFTLKGTYSHRHEGSSNEDAGSFDLYWIVVIDSSEMIF